MRVTHLTYEVLRDVRAERARQHRKFGDGNPMIDGPDLARFACLGEEFGEVAEAATESELFGHDRDDDIYKELVQVAALATLWAETMRRDGRVGR